MQVAHIMQHLYRKQVLLRHPVMRVVPERLRKEVWARIAVCDKPSFIYVRIPKAANSTVAKTLACHVYPERRQEFIDDPTGTLAKKSFGRMGGWPTWSSTLLRKKYFIFSFFRNPYSRLLSAYLDKIAGDLGNPKYRWVSVACGRDATADVTFAEFISLLENGHLLNDLHWVPQTVLCPFKIHELDMIGKIEDLQAGLNQVMEHLWQHREPNALVTRQHNRRNASHKLEAYYDKEIKERVYALYRDDFEQIGYAQDW
jgi:hypothetical protein